MRILITNDDGMHAAQLLPLIRWCQKLGDVTVFVPRVQQSGKSHGSSVNDPFEVKQVELAPDVTIWAVNSTPADCVRFAVLGMKMKFDLVISGINKGLNISSDIMYSGTIGAAGEAVYLGIPAVAISTTGQNYPAATEKLDEIFAYFKENDLFSKHTFYNVNIPANAKGIRITHQGGPFGRDHFEPIGNDMWEPKGNRIWEDSNNDFLDTDAVMHGYISVSPLTIERTDWTVFNELTKQEKHSR